MSQSDLNIYYNSHSLDHKLYPFFSEKPERLKGLVGDFVQNSTSITTSKIATQEQLLLAHSQRYIKHIEMISKQGLLKAFVTNTKSPHIQWYTRVSKGSYTAALVSAGGVCQAVDDVLEGKSNRAFCLARPPGHHAGRERGEGFCLFNNIAIGALYALEKGIKKVAIIDFDRHHGNGTEEIVRYHDNVLFISSFQEGCKYATKAKKRANTLPLAIPEHSSFEEVKKIYAKAIYALDKFKPELIFISAGFDMHTDDPLTNIKLESKDFYTLTQMIVIAAKELCDGRVISSLEGGYDVKALKECVDYHLKALEA
jgi:acetoin utilization deacetylase AcuC-like enzyme